MNPLLDELSRNIDTLHTKAELATALADLEDQYDDLTEIEQDIADKLITRLKERLDALDEED